MLDPAGSTLRDQDRAPRLTAVGGRAAWWAMAVVGLTHALSLVDRQVLAILVPHIKADLQVGDAEIGLLYGTVFALFYAVFSLPLGRVADGWVRTRLLGISIIAWSAMTALAGFATNFGTLALSRLGVGIGEASVQPAGLSLLSDRFPRAMKGTFSALMAVALAFGLGGAMWLGGAVAGWWDAHYPGGTAPLGLKGWQAAFIVAALPGPVIAALLFFTEEPTRGAADGIVSPPDRHPIRAGWHTLGAILPVFAWVNLARLRAGPSTWALNLVVLALAIGGGITLTRWTDGMRDVNPVALAIGSFELSGNGVQWLVLGFGLYVLVCWLQSLRLADRPTFVVLTTPAVLLTLAIAAQQTLISYAMLGWTPAFIIRTFHADPAGVGMRFGIQSAAIGMLAPLIAGPLSDRLAARFRAGRIYVIVASLVTSPIFAFLVYRAPTEGAFYLWFVFYSLTVTCMLPVLYATLLDLVLPRMRARVMSLYMLATTILGMGLGPYAVGLISDANGGRLGEAVLDLYWTAPFAIGLGLLLLWRLPRDEAALIDRARAAGERLG